MTCRGLHIRVTTISCIAAAVFLTMTLACDSTTGPDATPKAPEVRITSGQIVYADPWGGIFVADSNGKILSNLSAGSRDFAPAVSADGKKIAFSSWVTNEDVSDIWVMNADGTNRVRLTHNVTTSTSRFSTSPAWSPDGRRIAFVTSPDGTWDHKIFVMNADGSNIEQITDDEMDSVAPEWSPDGRSILFSRPSGYSVDVGIFEMNQDGSNVRRLHRGGGFPTRSPDGTRIAFSAGGLYVMDSDGSNVKLVLVSGEYFDWIGFVYGSKVAWSPDGKSIVFGIGSASRMCLDWDAENEYPCGVDLKRVSLDGAIDTTWQILSASSPVWQR